MLNAFFLSCLAAFGLIAPGFTNNNFIPIENKIGYTIESPTLKNIEINNALKPWSKAHLDLELSFEKSWWLMALQDVGQTTDFSAHGHKELNPLVKRWVDNKNLYEFVVVVALGCYLLDKAVHLIKDKTVRTILFAIFYLVESWAVLHNEKLFGKGIPIFFPVFRF
jgi:hypothetical protein